jgi:DNA-binding transcriptional regulator YhcF (GntR family)
VDILIDKKSEMPVWQQLAEQITFSIATEKLKPGEALPSVRELSRRLKIHRNTVSQAYRDLKRRAWLVGGRGSRVAVRELRVAGRSAGAVDLDDLINATIQLARERGYSLQELRERVKKRLLAEPPDRVLVVEGEIGLRRLLQEEIRSALKLPTDGCSIEDLAADRDLAIGALTVAAHYSIGSIEPLVSKAMPAIPLAFSLADEHLRFLRKLRQPSVIAVVSVSEVFLKTARSLLLPALGQRHSLIEFLFPIKGSRALKAADVILADSIVHPQLTGSRSILYRLIRPASLEYLVNALKSYQSK